MFNVTASSLFAALQRYRAQGLAAFFLVAGLLSLGLLMRDGFVATAKVQVGSIAALTPEGFIRLDPLQTLKDIEQTALKIAPPPGVGPLESLCEVEGAFSNKGPFVKIQCKDRDSAVAKNYVEAISASLLQKHAELSKTAKSFKQQKMESYVEKLRFLEEQIQKLSDRADAQTAPIALKLIDLQKELITTKSLNKEAAGFQGLITDSFVVDGETVVQDRRPTPLIWAFVFTLSAMAGLFVCLFLGFGSLGRRDGGAEHL